MKKINLVSLFMLLVCTMSLRAEAEQDLATLFPYLHSLCITEGYGSENHFDPGLHNTVIYHFHLQDTLTIHDKLYGKMGNNCFLREEGKKIWIYDDFSSKEFLLYDFGLEVGDSLPCIFKWNGYELTYDNGDYWKMVKATESARGNKCNISYIDNEIPFDIIHDIVKPCTKAGPYQAFKYF
jgi:hypothetical protein